MTEDHMKCVAVSDIKTKARVLQAEEGEDEFFQNCQERQRNTLYPGYQYPGDRHCTDGDQQDDCTGYTGEVSGIKRRRYL